jgi:hypothetical protein
MIGEADVDPYAVLGVLIEGAAHTVIRHIPAERQADTATTLVELLAERRSEYRVSDVGWTVRVQWDERAACDTTEAMMAKKPITTVTMIDLVAEAIAKADGPDPRIDPSRYRRLALAALTPLSKPTTEMIDAAHEVAWFGRLLGDQQPARLPARGQSNDPGGDQSGPRWRTMTFVLDRPDRRSRHQCHTILR